MTKKGKSENVQVVLRVRPINKKEIEAGYKECVHIDLSSNAVTVDGAGIDGRPFNFDAVYTNAFAQKDVYLQSIHPVVETVLQGYNATIFAYGQSGTGKTYSMVGNLDNPKQYGVIPHALDHIFSSITDMKNDKMEYTVQASFVELYNGKCRDLLVDGKTNLELKENSQKLFFVKDLSLWEIKDTLGAMRLMEDGITRREVKATELNSDSSRSHSLFTVYVRTWDKEQDLRTEAKLNLVDLAGSERQSKTGATGDTLKEGNNINLSLTALGTVIDCLVKQKPHIPYRSSPLTMLLKDGLGGNSRTVIVGTIGPSDSNSSETVSTLRFIDRAKQIKNKPKVQMDPKDAKIAELLEEVKKYKRQLGLLEDEDLDDDDGETHHNVVESPEKEERRKKSVRQADDEIEKLQRRIEELEVQLASVQDPEALERLLQSTAAKEHALKDQMKQLEESLRSEIADLNDKLSLQDSDNYEVQSALETLRTVCLEFLHKFDKEKQWSSSLKVSKKTGAVEATVDDLARGLKLMMATGLEQRVASLRKTSMNNNQPPAQQGPSSGLGSVSPRTVTSEPPTPTGGNSSTTSSVPQQHSTHNIPQPPSQPQVQKNLQAQRQLTPSQDIGGGYSARGEDNNDTPVDNENEFGAKPSKKDKKEKKEKKEKKDKKDKKEKKAAVLEMKAQVAALPEQKITEVLQSFGVDASSVAVRNALEEILQMQRTELLNAFSSRSSELAGDAGDLLADKQQAAELIVAFGQLQDEVEMLRNAAHKQKSQQDKSKAVAEKKMLEVTQLKEHIDALRDELGAQQAKFDADMQMQQEKLVQQFNKKTEMLVAKHTKNLAKERKQRDQLDHKIEDLTQQLSQMEQDYDNKILEFENLQRDFEALKVENLRRFREQQQAQFGEELAAQSAGGTAPKMKRIVQASIVLDRLSGRNQVVKTEEMRPEPNTAPESSGTNNNVLPLPSLQRGAIFQRSLPF